MLEPLPQSTLYVLEVALSSKMSSTAPLSAAGFASPPVGTALATRCAAWAMQGRTLVVSGGMGTWAEDLERRLFMPAWLSRFASTMLSVYCDGSPSAFSTCFCLSSPLSATRVRTFEDATPRL